MKKKLSEMTLEELWRLFPITLKEYNADYPHIYERQSKEITNLLEGKKYRISHIGSTAIPNILSKAIIDILLEVRKEEFPDLSLILQAAGWTLMQATDKPLRSSFNKGYTENGFADEVFHLHLRISDDCDEIYFRDYLRANPEIAKEYETLKLGLAKSYKHDRDGYTSAKRNFVEKYTDIAKKNA